MLHHRQFDFNLNSSLYSSTEVWVCVQTSKYFHLISSLDPCADVRCDYYASCQNGKCVCPSCKDNQMYDPVCDVTGLSHANECYLKSASCKQKKIIPISKRESCGKNLDVLAPFIFCIFRSMQYESSVLIMISEFLLHLFAWPFFQ